MKFFAAIAALAVAAVVKAQQPTFTNCATGPTDLTISTFSLNPYPLCIGQNVCASGTGQLSVPVTAGVNQNLTITGRYLNRVVYSDTYNLCDLLAAQGNPCPIPVTQTSITACVPVKSNAPADIPVVLTVTANNGGGSLLFCQRATVTASNCA